jgi:hypothetical protein
MRVFEDFLCAEETFANCEHEMCVDAVVDANMFVFDRDVYISGLFFVLNFTRNESEREKRFWVFLPFFCVKHVAAFFNNFFSLVESASQQKGVVVVIIVYF